MALYGLFTPDDTENEFETDNENDNYGFHCNMQHTLHCTETLLLMPLTTFSLLVDLGIGIGLGVAQYEQTTNHNLGLNLSCVIELLSPKWCQSLTNLKTNFIYLYKSHTI